MSAIDFNQRRVLITGAGQGIGRAIVDYLSSCNARIVAVDLSQESLNKLKADIPTADTLCVNLTDWNATESILSEYLENNDVHHLVNNAGVTRLASVGKVPVKDIEFVFDVNVKSLINVTQCIVNQMLKKNLQGSIVNISSQAGCIALKDHLVYAGSKGALNTMTKVMALELGQYNIRSNCICPTVVNTAMAIQAWGEGDLAAEFKSKIPLKRFAEPIEIAQPVAFLLSDLSSMVTGIEMPVDGGYMCQVSGLFRRS